MKVLRIVSDGEERQTDRDINGSLAVQSFQRSPRYIIFHAALVSRCHMVKPQRYWMRA
jgi:hypothetical protein